MRRTTRGINSHRSLVRSIHHSFTIYTIYSQNIVITSHSSLDIQSELSSWAVGSRHAAAAQYQQYSKSSITGSWVSSPVAQAADISTSICKGERCSRDWTGVGGCGVAVNMAAMASLSASLAWLRALSLVSACSLSLVSARSLS